MVMPFKMCEHQFLGHKTADNLPNKIKTNNTATNANNNEKPTDSINDQKQTLRIEYSMQKVYDSCKKD